MTSHKTTGRDGCPTCMNGVWMRADDDVGGKTVSFLCTAEYYYSAEGAVRMIKCCPEASTLFDESQYRKGS